MFFVGWNKSYLQLRFYIIFLNIYMYHTCIWCILVFYISLHMSYKYIYIYICFQPASHGDMTSSMVLKSPARPVLDGPVPPWRLGSNSGYVTDRWMWKKWWEKMMGFLHRTVKWNQMGYRTTSSLCRPWNCFFFLLMFFLFPEHFFTSRIWTRWPATLQLEGRNHRYKTAWDGWDSSPGMNDFCLHIWSG